LKISFTSAWADHIIHPVPVKKVVPNWYKELQLILEQDVFEQTIKKCQPVLDSITMGYAILSPCDLIFSKDKTFTENKEPVFEINVHVANTKTFENLHKKEIKFDMNIGVGDHKISQISPSMIYPDELSIAFKFLNPWMIKTPPGYSCLFTSPFNTEKQDIRIVTGIVDTDNHNAFVNFPFFLRDWDHNKNRQKIVKKGTPISLVFPFKRDTWVMSVIKDVHLKEKTSKWDWNYFSTVLNTYKNKVWTKKSYK
tara:strand:- start:1804 stop:2562 length:759 start_codon:yes stop_codon:yes gene_type:complete